MNAPQNPSRGEIAIYRASNGGVELDVRLERETIWLRQKQMSLLFEKDTDTIGLHLRNIFKEGDLEEVATTEESLFRLFSCWRNGSVRHGEMVA